MSDQKHHASVRGVSDQKHASVRGVPDHTDDAGVRGVRSER